MALTLLSGGGSLVSSKRLDAGLIENQNFQIRQLPNGELVPASETGPGSPTLPGSGIFVAKLDLLGNSCCELPLQQALVPSNYVQGSGGSGNRLIGTHSVSPSLAINPLATPTDDNCFPVTKRGITPTASDQWYPNPASDLVKLRILEEGAVTVYAYNARGQQCYHETFASASAIQLQVRDWPAGLYLLKTVQNGASNAQRLVVR